MNLLSFASQLASARLRSRKGAGMLDSFAVAAFAGSSGLALTTMGGVWMFQQRRSTLDAQAAANLGIPEFVTHSTGDNLAFFALIALAILVVPIFSLGMGAARLGAQGRSHRFASLRLLGMTAGEVRRLALVETCVQFAVGFAIGFILYVATLPLWHLVSFGTVPIHMSEMLLPWWLVIATGAMLALVAAFSTLIGLIQVSISPLGVSRRAVPLGWAWWRLVIFVVIVVAVAVGARPFMAQGAGETGVDMKMVFIAYLVVILVVLAAMAIVGPFAVQILGRIVLGTRNPARLIAARRLIGDPRAAWRNVSGVVLMGMIAALITLLAQKPIFSNPATLHIDKSDPHAVSAAYTELIEADVTKGVLIALAFTLLLGALSTLIQQASDVFDRAQEERTLVLVGVPEKVFASARAQQVLVPFVVLMGIAMGLGAFVAVSSLTSMPLEE
ncbi:MAG: hypothetical protein MR006_07450, partial [Arcanobacterium sp.]|nr:hypothetical protein [Arcanobacterium sp.]